MTREKLTNGNKWCHIYTDTDGIVNYHDTERNETYRVIPDRSALGFHLEYHKDGELKARNSISFAEMKSIASLAGSNHLLRSLVGSEINTHIEKSQICADEKSNLESPMFKSGVSLITEERQRQIEVEGWNEEHDDFQAVEELAFAAACYAIPESSRIYLKSNEKPNLWLWEKEWWKPTPNDRIKELVKAGALIAAEIDRLQRKLGK
jgi:hypothetical protein